MSKIFSLDSSGRGYKIRMQRARYVRTLTNLWNK